jgi:hypothetical protein
MDLHNLNDQHAHLRVGKARLRDPGVETLSLAALDAGVFGYRTDAGNSSGRVGQEMTKHLEDSGFIPDGGQGPTAETPTEAIEGGRVLHPYDFSGLSGPG